MLGKLFETREKADQEKIKPISINIMLMPFSFTPGSKDSLEQLMTLKAKGMSFVYNSECTQNYVNYKMTQVMNIGYLKLFIYLVYLLTINI